MAVNRPGVLGSALVDCQIVTIVQKISELLVSHICMAAADRLVVLLELS